MTARHARQAAPRQEDRTLDGLRPPTAFTISQMRLRTRLPLRVL